MEGARKGLSPTSPPHSRAAPTPQLPCSYRPLPAVLPGIAACHLRCSPAACPHQPRRHSPSPDRPTVVLISLINLAPREPPQLEARAQSQLESGPAMSEPLVAVHLWPSCHRKKESGTLLQSLLCKLSAFVFYCKWCNSTTGPNPSSGNTGKSEMLSGALGKNLERKHILPGVLFICIVKGKPCPG